MHGAETDQDRALVVETKRYSWERMVKSVGKKSDRQTDKIARQGMTVDVVRRAREMLCIKVVKQAKRSLLKMKRGCGGLRIVVCMV